ncbi:glycosyltransferase [Candidatus Poribacteria bacterium]|nr:glycosyltransferase [Candidatus Poribacteria bacterium]
MMADHRDDIVRLQPPCSGASLEQYPVDGVSAQDSKLERVLSAKVLRYKLNELRLVNEYQKREQQTKVSVIMPTWNRAFIIERAIDSVLRQSYSNFEIIISDDGSSDNTAELVGSQYGDDPRIVYIRNLHEGVSHARNVGLERSSGELIAYLDSDNHWSSDFLLLMVNTFVDNPGINSAYCSVQVVDNVRGRKFLRLQHYDRKQLLIRNYIDLNIFMHKRSLYEEIGGFNEQLTALVDWELILRYTKDNAPIALQCNLATYYLEKDFGQITNTEDLWKNYDMVRRLHNERPENAEEKRWMRKSC